jgi:hypothetical protein
VHATGAAAPAWRRWSPCSWRSPGGG